MGSVFLKLLSNLGLLIEMTISKFNIQTLIDINSIEGEKINPPEKGKRYFNYLIGGIIFGLGWALTGACPGPIYIIIGTGTTVFIVVLLSAIFGTFVYGLVRNKLPR